MWHRHHHRPVQSITQHQSSPFTTRRHQCMSALHRPMWCVTAIVNAGATIIGTTAMTGGMEMATGMSATIHTGNAAKPAPWRR